MGPKMAYYRQVQSYHAKWSPYPRSEQDWTEAGDEMAAAVHRANDDELLQDLYIAAWNDLGREWCAARQKGVVK